MDMHENSNVATSSPAVAKALHSKLVSFFTDHARDRDKSISLAAGALQTDAPARQQAGAGTGHPPSVPQTAAHTVLGWHTTRPVCSMIAPVPVHVPVCPHCLCLYALSLSLPLPI